MARLKPGHDGFRKVAALFSLVMAALEAAIQAIHQKPFHGAGWMAGSSPAMTAWRMSSRASGKNLTLGTLVKWRERTLSALPPENPKGRP